MAQLRQLLHHHVGVGQRGAAVHDPTAVDVGAATDGSRHVQATAQTLAAATAAVLDQVLIFDVVSSSNNKNNGFLKSTYTCFNCEQTQCEKMTKESKVNGSP